MIPTKEILERIRNNSRNHPDETFTKLFRYLLRPDLYLAAYEKLCAQKRGATTDMHKATWDRSLYEEVEQIIQTLATRSYTPQSVHRTFLEQKGSKKQHSQGNPTFTDNLVQEALRMILEAVFEPTFSPYSYGLRPNRSSHAALKSLKREFADVSWFIKGDLRSCNLDPRTLIQILQKKVKDARLTALIGKFLKAGVLKDWNYHATYSGYSQGNILSPVLANIYLNELDQFAHKVIGEFGQPRECVHTAKGKAIPLSPGMEMKYIRCADVFIIGVKGSREDCKQLKARFENFLSSQLKMDLSEEKISISHSSKRIQFLGYHVRVTQGNTVKPAGDHSTPLPNGTVELCVPFHEVIMPYLFRTSTIKQKQDGAVEPVPENTCTTAQTWKSCGSTIGNCGA